MRNYFLLLVVLGAFATCAPKEAPPMAGTCVLRAAPNYFSDYDDKVPFQQCVWQGKTWICRVEDGADAWRCVAVGQAN